MANQRFNFRIWILAAAVAMLSATAGVALWKMTQMPRTPVVSSMTILPQPRVIDDFELQDDRGQQFSQEQLRGHWTLMFFGFTHCPDVCPTALFELQNVKQRLEEAGEKVEIPHIVFVSVDPERDSAEKLARYLAYFDPDFLGVTGPDERLLPFTRQVGVAYRIEDHDAGAVNYGVDHSSGIFLFDPDGRLYGVFTAPHQSEMMAADLLTVLEPR